MSVKERRIERVKIYMLDKKKDLLIFNVLFDKIILMYCVLDIAGTKWMYFIF